MISQQKIDSLTDEELNILLYALNLFKTSDSEINMPELKWIRPQFAFLALNDLASKTKEEKRYVLQGIADKLMN